MRKKIKSFISLGRYDRPTGAVLLFIPALLSYAINYDMVEGFPFWYVALCFLGALFARGAGCTINDIWDKKFDKMVERTKSRPIASGAISIKQAMIFLFLQASISLFVLLQFPIKAIMVGVISVPFVAIYPLMKRLINFPQLFLGVTFSIPIIFAAYSLSHFNYDLTMILFILHVIMVVAYDNVYAHQDIDDDLKVGVKSSAIALSGYNRSFIISSYLLIALLLLLIGYMGNYGWLFFILSSLLMSFTLYGVIKLNLKNKKDCFAFFKLNQYIGLAMAVIILMGRNF